VRVLLIDTCGDKGSIALGEGDAIVGSELLPARGSSSSLLPAIKRLLDGQRWTLSDLDAIGVVNGPGSFTGVRVGLAAAKGFCEAASLPLACVSRLEVLAETANLQDGCAVLDAGRGELYVRFVHPGEAPREVLCRKEGLRGRVVIAEEKLAEPLSWSQPELFAIGTGPLLNLALKALQAGATDAGLAEANYVRSESQIYAKAGGAA